jgi:hypothetical protein
VPAADGGVEAAVLQAGVERAHLERLDVGARAQRAQLALQEHRHALAHGAARGHEHGEGERHAGAGAQPVGPGAPAERVELGAGDAGVVRDGAELTPAGEEGARHRTDRDEGERIEGVAHHAVAVHAHGQGAAQGAVREEG